LPIKPEGDDTWQDTPLDLTDISYKELGDRLAYITGWLEFAESRVGVAELKVTDATKALKEREASLLEEADAKDKWKFDRLLPNDKVWAARKFNLDVAEAYLTMTTRMLKKFEKGYGAISREMTRRAKAVYTGPTGD